MSTTERMSVGSKVGLSIVFFGILTILSIGVVALVMEILERRGILYTADM